MKALRSLALLSFLFFGAPAWATNFIGACTGGTTTCTVPTHAINDLILIYAYRSGSATAPSLPASYTSILTTSDSTNSVRVGYKIATATNDTSGTWTNASQTVGMVYRASPGNSIVIGSSKTNDGSSTTVNYPALTLQQGNGTSWVVGFAGMVGIAETLSTPPAGMTNRVAITGTAIEAVGHDTNGGVTSWPSTNVSVGGSAAIWITAMVEVIDFPPSGTHGGWDITGLGNSGQDPSFFYLSGSGDQTATASAESAGPNISSTDSNSTGKYYFEITCVATVGSNEGDNIGVTGGEDYFIIAPSGSWYSSVGGGTSGTIASYTNGNVERWAVDFPDLLIWVANGNGNWNNNGSANPATGSGGISITVAAALYIVFGDPGGAGSSYTINTGTTAFAYTPPSGFANWYGSPAGTPPFLIYSPSTIP